MLVEFGVEHWGVHVRPGTGRLLGPGLGGVQVVGRGQHGVDHLAYPGPVQSDRRVEQHQRRDLVWAGRGQVHSDSAAEGVSDHHYRTVALIVEECCQGGHVGVDGPRRGPW
ncbi:Uncharacterised protein [Mycobacterium tuberculosis]|uniref:Uncharacterized protein n=1 Tax=Mycobacterium tuberculosis TaxID=1773 RepID=A0A654ZKJ4_MYCTX|nr:Uncharacterised protein [Mycobacterium tuberculosis]CKS73037.1 Uncharacterised protein [Mycobacterium tuberculosis]CKV05473.1 Uncharacterised protein [Mycobacterium tuberculosis]CNV44636.1 Uncharacterised protein [Mycobacterium tuberculosis]CNV56872.1 Uncharacterised protein [Mycobacterium tuberculosis]